MLIANPIYDSVFKYLLEDNDVAKLMLSTLIGEEIIDLEFNAQEQIAPILSRQLRAYRLDFVATMKNSQGQTRKVLIEIQKAKRETDIPRFRCYLGKQYCLEDKKTLPILTLYFLGYSLEYHKVPVIHIKRNCLDVATGEILNQREIFIESLTHDSYVVQIPSLSKYKRTEIEKMLQVFDQTRVIDADKHFLDIEASEIPVPYQLIFRRLQIAAVTPNMEQSMRLEDEVLRELQTLEQKLEFERTEKERAQFDKQQTEQLLAKEQAEKEKLLNLLHQLGVKLN